MFFLFSFFSAVAVFFVYFYIAESKGLSDREKKALFIPGAEYGRKLREGETQPQIPHTPVPAAQYNKVKEADESFRSDL